MGKQTKDKIEELRDIIKIISISAIVIIFFTMAILYYVAMRNEKNQSDLKYCIDVYNDMSWKVYHNPCELYGSCNYSSEPFLNCSKYVCYGGKE